jgi:hypothetical protein
MFRIQVRKFGQIGRPRGWSDTWSTFATRAEAEAAIRSFDQDGVLDKATYRILDKTNKSLPWGRDD